MYIPELHGCSYPLFRSTLCIGKYKGAIHTFFNAYIHCDQYQCLYSSHAHYYVPTRTAQAMESKLLVGGRSIVDHTHEQQKKLDQHKQEIAQQEVCVCV